MPIQRLEPWPLSGVPLVTLMGQNSFHLNCFCNLFLSFFGSLIHSHCFRLHLNILPLIVTSKIITCSDLRCSYALFSPLLVPHNWLWAHKVICSQLCDLLDMNLWQWDFPFPERQAGSQELKADFIPTFFSEYWGVITSDLVLIRKQPEGLSTWQLL